jgi:hypothetical protein
MYQSTHDQYIRFRLTKTTYEFKKVVSEEIPRRVRRHSSANKDIQFYLFYSSIVINTAIVTAGTFEP